MTYDTYSYKLYLKCSVNASEEDYALLKLDRLLDSIYEYLEDSGFELEDIEVQ
jgi:sporulation-control protein spo0M